jgi:PPK2 family polyphosphate:nucleotide phosphotransferase
MDLAKKLRIPSKGVTFGESGLHGIKPDDTPSAKDREGAEEKTAENIKAIRELQFQVFTEGKQSLLIILQAPDAAGKDGLIRKVLGQMNPQGCVTHGFKKPTDEELAHDFLWRVHARTPQRGQVTIFNRSHYEDVLVVRVQELVPPAVWKERFDHINAFEKLLTDNGTTIIKFYLHISREEQLERFKARLDDPWRHWKLNAGDYAERKRWMDYHEAYLDVFRKCNPDSAPWYVIPADRKWYRDFAVSEITKKVLEKMNPQPPQPQVDLEEIRALYEAAK